ncbi:MAG: quinolinate synthase NadA [Candidatus Heimdallarchaeota archaeon]|nr:quinolinate synthase NadA [Candidatus Heimdallarchaeota archaeon]
MKLVQSKYTPKQIASMSEEIRALKKEKNAIILAHYYQELEIQDLADLIGDSLGLAKAAREIENADIIVFAGVYFMAETAKLLNPTIKVLIPNVNAGCPLANQCNPNLIAEARVKHPNIPVVVYVNTTAETKAAADICCTSSNATQIVKKLNSKKVLFGPDSNLGKFVQKQLPDVEVIPVPEDGYCIVHKRFDLKSIQQLKKEFPESLVMAHPECNIEIQEIADYVGSTSGMLRFGKESDAKVIIVATEKGLVDRLNQDHPEKRFILAKSSAICRNMKKINLENLRDSLLYEQFEVNIPKEIREKAEQSIVRMLELS